MIKRLLTKFLITIIVLLNTIFAFYPTTVFAAETAEFYGIEISNINNDLVKRYVQSLYLKPEGSAYRLIVNNTSIGSIINTGTLYYYPNSNVKIGFNVDIPNKKITFSYNKIKTKNITAKFVFHATDFDSKDWQKLTIYPNTEVGTNTTLSAELNGGWFRFPSYTYTYDSDNSFTYIVSINTNTNTCYIDCNGSTHNYSLSGGTVEKTLYVEAWINAQELELNYLGKLKPYNFATASSHTTLYSEEQINNAVSSFTGDKRLVLKNTPTGLTADFDLLDSIYYMERTSGGAEGTGSYGASTARRVKVICEYWDTEHMCENVRSTIANGNRLYAVFAHHQNANEITTNTMSVPRKNATKTSDALYYWPTLTGEGRIEYSKRTATWTDYSNWTTDRAIVDECEYKFDCSWKSQKYYRYRTSSMSNWSDWTTDKVEKDRCEHTSNCSWEYKTEYSDWTYGNSQTGSYTDQCEWKYYTKNYSCGYEYEYSDYGAYEQNKYGSYSSHCSSRTGNNSECGVSSYTYSDYGAYEQNKYGSYSSHCSSRTGNNSECGVSSYTYSDYGAYQTSKYGSYSSHCSSRTGNNSECGSENKTCNKYYCAKTKTCTKKVLGLCTSYSYSNYTYVYGDTSGYYNCSNKGSVTSSSCGTKTKKCTSYSCPSKATANYAKCTSYSCPKTQTSKYASCYMWNCPSTKTTSYRTRSKTYTSWTDYKFTSCPSIPSTQVECDSPIVKYATREKIWGDWGSWITTTTAFNDSVETQYRYRTITKGPGEETINVIGSESKEIGVLPRMTENQINEKAAEYDKAYAVSQTLSDAKDFYEENYISSLEYWSWAAGEGKSKYNTNLANSTAGKNFKNSEIFVPYVYIAGHWRAQDKLFNIAAYDTQEKQMIKAIDVAEKGNDGPYDLIAYEQEISRDSKVVYFDYHDPLANYEGNIPDDLEGLDELINKLENTDFSNAKISITISKSDMDNMKKWLKENNYRADEDCSFLKAFAYVFDEETRSKISSMACRTREGD